MSTIFIANHTNQLARPVSIRLELLLDVLLDPNRRRLYQFVDARDLEEAAAFDINPNDNYTDMTVVSLPVTSISEWTEHLESIINKERPTICFCNNGIKSSILADYLGKCVPILWCYRL